MAKIIVAAGLDRINKSVYLDPIADSSLKILENQLQLLMQQKADPTDSLIFLPLTKVEVRNMRIYAHNGLDPDELTGNKSKGLSHLGKIEVSSFLEKRASEVEKESGYDIADYLLRFAIIDFHQK